ncbi:MAG: hypothetical protein AAFO82_04460 [Bacteroidota bacterium]
MRLGLLIIVFIVGCYSTNAQNTALKNYQENSIYLKQGLFNNNYVKEGKVYPRGFMDSRLKKELEISPNAVVEFKKYRKNQWIAIGMALGYSILYASSIPDNEVKVVPVIAVGSLVTGTIVSLHSLNKLEKAIWHYNQDILR